MKWMDEAVCRQVDLELFFPEGGGNGASARKVCNRCEVKKECLAYALSFPSVTGIWGGTTERQRRKLPKT